MATVKIKFRPSIVSSKEGTLSIQIIHNRIARQIGIGYKVFPHEWDRSRSEVIIPPGTDELRRAHLTTVKNGINENVFAVDNIIKRLELSGNRYTSAQVIEAYLSAQTDGFVSYMRSLIHQLNQIGKNRTAGTYTTTMNSFIRFYGIKEVPWEQVDAKLMVRYEVFLKENGICPNTSSYYMRNLRAMYNRAVECELTFHRNPFRDVYTGVDKTVKRAIPQDAIKRLGDLNLNSRPSADLARDIFMFSFYTRGMSFIDIAFLRKEDIQNGILSYRRKKTNQHIVVKWEKQMQEIVDKYDTVNSPYLLPLIKNVGQDERRQYLTAAHRINRNLKIIGKQLGLSMPLTCYVARHTWASIAKSKNIPISVISEAMGHDSESTTRIYLASLDTSVIDKANKLIIGLL